MGKLTLKDILSFTGKNSLLKKTSTKVILGFALLLVLLICLLFCFKFTSNEKGNIITELQTVTQAIRTHYQKQIDYRGLNNQTVLKDNLLPKVMIRNNKIFSFLKKEIVIGKDENGSTCLPFDRFFSVAYLNVNQSTCISLVSQNFDIESGLISITIKQKDGIHQFTYGGSLALPIKEDTAKKYCSTQNTVTFAFE